MDVSTDQVPPVMEFIVVVMTRAPWKKGAS